MNSLFEQIYCIISWLEFAQSHPTWIEEHDFQRFEVPTAKQLSALPDLNTSKDSWHLLDNTRRSMAGDVLLLPISLHQRAMLERKHSLCQKASDGLSFLIHKISFSHIAQSSRSLRVFVVLLQRPCRVVGQSSHAYGCFPRDLAHLGLTAAIVVLSVEIKSGAACSATVS